MKKYIITEATFDFLDSWGRADECKPIEPLISAASDLLEALQVIADIGDASATVNSLRHIANLAKAAIAKAAGETPGPGGFMVTPRKHRHADMIRRWLDDDSLKVEFSYKDCWIHDPSPDWFETRTYRFKPKMIKCGNTEFPEPMRVAPAFGTKYWSVRIEIGTPEDILSDTCIWKNDRWDGWNLQRGLSHTTQAAAEAHAHALIALTESKS